MRRTPRLSQASSPCGLLRSVASALLALCLIALSPGLPCYQALAADFEAGGPKGGNIRIIPALDLSQVKTGGAQVPGAEIPAIQTVVPQTDATAVTGTPGAEIPVLPPAAAGLMQTAVIGEGGVELAAPKIGAIDRPLAETALRAGVAAIEETKSEGRGGVLSWFWSGTKKGSDAVQTGPAYDERTQSAFSKYPVSDLTAIARDQKRPSKERMSAVKAIADRSDDPAKLALEEIGTGAPVGDSKDYEVRRQALRALAQQGKLVSLPAISPELKQEINSQLAANKPSKAIFDWDGTWEPRGDKASAETGAALKAMADSGTRPAILTGRPYVSREPGQITIQEALAPLSPEQKQSIDVLSDRGARSLLYKGDELRPVHQEAPWTEREREALAAAGYFVPGVYGTGLRAEQYSRSDDYSFTLYLRGDVNLEDAAADFKRRLAEVGVKVDVNVRPARDGRPASLLVNKYDKSTGVETALGSKRSPSKTVLVGDYFFGDHSVDSGMTRGAPGALALAVGGSADPRIDNVFVWDKQGHEAAVEIAAALSQPAPPKSDTVSQARSWLSKAWNNPGPKAPGPDDPINVKTLVGLVLPRLVGMSAYMLVTLAFVGASVPVVGWIGYGLLMSLSPMAGIAAANIMGNMVKTMGARNAMIINGALRVISLSALPLFHLFGIMNFGTLLVGALAEGWLLSSIMTTEGSFLPALFPVKKLKDINGALFMMFPAVQVILGIWAHVGRFADGVSPFAIFAGAAALNLFVVLPLVWFLIPNTKLSQNQPAAGAPAEAAVPVLRRIANFGKKYWKEMALLGAAVGLFAGLTFGLPALAAAGIGGKAIAAVAAYLRAHSALTAPLPIVAALVYWITRTEGFQALKRGHTAKASEEEKGLYDKRGALAAEISQLRRDGAALAAINAKEDELAAVSDGLKAYRGRQLKTIMMMSLGAIMFYPLYLVAAPHVAETLAGSAGKLEMAGQFLGALFFGNWISTAARTQLPSFKLPLPGGRKIEVNTTRLAQGAVVALFSLFMATKVFIAGTLLGTLGVAAGAMAVATGLIALASRITDRGWIKFMGVGFAAVSLPFVVWTWPALIPFLTVKTAMLLALLAAGVVNGPNFVSLISYLMGNTERSENSKVTGVQGAFFNAAISTGYALLTIASGFLNPAYPAVLAILGLANLLIGGVFWRAPRHLPGLSPTIFIPKTPKAPAAPAQTTKEVVK